MIYSTDPSCLKASLRSHFHKFQAKRKPSPKTTNWFQNFRFRLRHEAEDCDCFSATQTNNCVINMEGEKANNNGQREAPVAQITNHFSIQSGSHSTNTNSVANQNQ